MLFSHINSEVFVQLLSYCFGWTLGLIVHCRKCLQRKLVSLWTVSLSCSLCVRNGFPSLTFLQCWFFRNTWALCKVLWQGRKLTVIFPATLRDGKYSVHQILRIAKYKISLCHITYYLLQDQQMTRVRLKFSSFLVDVIVFITLPDSFYLYPDDAYTICLSAVKLLLIITRLMINVGMFIYLYINLYSAPST